MSKARIVHGLACAGLLLGTTSLRFAAAEDPAMVARGRDLVRSKRLDERLDGVRLLIEANAAGSVQPLEDVIKQGAKDMDRAAKEMDKLDVQFDTALGYWDSARTSNNREFYDMAKRYLEIVEALWSLQSTKMLDQLAISTAAGDGFARLTSPAAFAAIAAGAKSEPDPLVRQWYVRGLAPTGDRFAGIPVLLGLLASGDPMTRALAARALVVAGMDKRVYDAAVVATADKSWQVRAAAYETIARAPLDFAAPRLVEAAGKERGEMARLVDDLLFARTRMSFPGDPRAWGPWWKENGEAVIAGTYAPTTADVGPTTLETFFSIPLSSENVLFALDYSASMEEALDLDDARNLEIRAQYKLGATRLGVAQAETIRAVRGLPATAVFQLVVFADKARRLAGRPLSATPANKASAVTWLLAQKTGWLTNIHDGLRASFDDVLAVGGSATRFLDLPDTIVFLTDGKPTRGRFQKDEAIETLVRLWNGPVGAAIHTVGVGEDHAKALLEALSDATNGTNLDVSVRRAPARRRRASVPADAQVPAVGPTIESARDELVGSGDAASRAALVRRIGLLSDWSEVALGLTVDRLGDEQDAVRRAAVQVLAALAPPYAGACVALALRHLERGLDAWDAGCEASIRLAAALGPAATGAVDILVKLVAAPGSPHRLEAARALGAIGPAAAKGSVATLVATRALPTTDAELKQAIDAALNRIRR